MKKIVLLLLPALLVISCKTKQEQQENFNLNAIVKNVPDSTRVFLREDNTTLDSTLVIDGRFSFSGKVEEPINVHIFLPETMDAAWLWLENKDMELTAEKGKFREAVVTGSEIQEDHDRLNSGIFPLRRARDSANVALSEKEKLSEAEKKSAKAFFRYLEQKEVRTYHDFIIENPGSVVSSYILNFYKTTWGRKTTKELFAHLSEDRKSSSHGRMTGRFLELNKNPDIGDAYADFEMNNAAGEPVRLSEVRGKYTLLHFWAAHCYFSQQTNPGLVQNYEQFKDKGFEVVGVSIDSDSVVFESSIAGHGLPWTNVMSAEGKDNDAALTYGIAGTPDNFLIDENGIIIARDLRGERLTEKLQELIAASQESAKL